MRIYERELKLSEDERNTLLFLTSGLKVIKVQELTKEDLWNLKQYFGSEIKVNEDLLKVIVFKDRVVIKLRRN